jgi:hypothetical protein
VDGNQIAQDRNQSRLIPDLRVPENEQIYWPPEPQLASPEGLGSYDGGDHAKSIPVIASY